MIIHVMDTRGCHTSRLPINRRRIEKKEKAKELACLQQKLSDKKQLYGKVTYDELYDCSACNQ